MVTIEAVRFAGNEPDLCGLGVVQNIEDAEMQVYCVTTRQTSI